MEASLCKRRMGELKANTSTSPFYHVPNLFAINEMMMSVMGENMFKAVIVYVTLMKCSSILEYKTEIGDVG